MKIKIQKIFFTLLVALLLNACHGEVLFRTKPCEEGTIQRNGECISDVFTKGSNENCKDPDLTKVRQGVKITLCNGSLGEGSLTVPTSCTKDGEQNCFVPSDFIAVDVNKVVSSDIRYGKVIAGITGSFKGHQQCRNYSALSTFDSSYPPSNLGFNSVTFLPAAVDLASDQITFSTPHGLIANSFVRFTSTATLPTPLVTDKTYYAIYISNTIIQLASVPNGAKIDIDTQGIGTHTAHDVSDSTAQYFDTIDDHNNDLTLSPTNNPWNSDYYICDASNFVNVTSTSAPFLPSGITPPSGSSAFTQIWQDQISGMYVSNIISVSGSSRFWSDVVRACEFINGGTAGEGWRLPTQKELMQLYIHGISKVPLEGGSKHSFFASSTHSSSNLMNGIFVRLSNGQQTAVIRSGSSMSALCVR